MMPQSNRQSHLEKQNLYTSADFSAFRQPLPHAQELAENALRNSGWFGILVNDILGMDRIELGTLNYSFMHHDLAPIR